MIHVSAPQFLFVLALFSCAHVMSMDSVGGQLALGGIALVNGIAAGGFVSEQKNPRNSITFDVGKIGMLNVLPYVPMLYDGVTGLRIYLTDLREDGITQEDLLQINNLSIETKQAVQTVCARVNEKTKKRLRFGITPYNSYVGNTAESRNDYLVVMRPSFEKQSLSEKTAINAHEIGHVDSQSMRTIVAASFIIPPVTEAAFWMANKLIEGKGVSAKESGGMLLFVACEAASLFLNSPLSKYCVAQGAYLWLRRREEHKADEYATRLGFGKQMIEWLEKSPSSLQLSKTNSNESEEPDVEQRISSIKEARSNAPFWFLLRSDVDRLFLGSSHPSDEKRVATIQRMMAKMEKNNESCTQ